MATTTVMPSQKRRQRARMDAITPPPARNRVTATAQARRPLETLLTTAGWTRTDLQRLRSVSNEHLALLISSLSPDDVDTYAAWGEIATHTGLTDVQLRSLLSRAPAVSPALLLGLLRHAQAYARDNARRFLLTALPTPIDWALAHAAHHNAVGEASRYDYTTPAWLIAWLRAGDLPQPQPAYPVGEAHLWAYIDAAAAFPDAPDVVLAATITHAPSLTAPAGTVEAWVMTSWADPTSLATGA